MPNEPLDLDAIEARLNNAGVAGTGHISSAFGVAGREYRSFLLNAAPDISALIAEVRALRERVSELTTTVEKASVDLDVQATFWVPGSQMNVRNPYARQMFEALRGASQGLRNATRTQSGEPGGKR